MDKIILKEYKDLKALINTMLDELEGVGVDHPRTFVLEVSKDEKTKFLNDLVKSPMLFTPDRKMRGVLDTMIEEKDYLKSYTHYYIGPMMTKLEIDL